MTISDWINKADQEQADQERQYCRALAEWETLARDQTITVLTMAGLQDLVPLLHVTEGMNIADNTWRRLPKPYELPAMRHWRLDPSSLGIAELSVVWVKHWGVYVCLPMSHRAASIGNSPVRISDKSTKDPAHPVLVPGYESELAKFLQGRRDQYLELVETDRRNRVSRLKELLAYSFYWQPQTSEDALAKLADLDPDNAQAYGEKHAASLRRWEEDREAQRQRQEEREAQERHKARQAQLLSDYEAQVDAWLETAKAVQLRNLDRTMAARTSLGKPIWHGWSLRYAIASGHKLAEDAFVEYQTETVYVKSPEPDGDGFWQVADWPLWQHGLARLSEPYWKRCRYQNWVAVEPVVVDLTDYGLRIGHHRQTLFYSPDDNLDLIRTWADSLEQLPQMPVPSDELAGVLLYDVSQIQSKAWHDLDEANPDIPDELGYWI